MPRLPNLLVKTNELPPALNPEAAHGRFSVNAPLASSHVGTTTVSVEGGGGHSKDGIFSSASPALEAERSQAACSLDGVLLCSELAPAQREVAARALRDVESHASAVDARELLPHLRQLTRPDVPQGVPAVALALAAQFAKGSSFAPSLCETPKRWDAAKVARFGQPETLARLKHFAALMPCAATEGYRPKVEVLRLLGRDSLSTPDANLTWARTLDYKSEAETATPAIARAAELPAAVSEEFVRAATALRQSPPSVRSKLLFRLLEDTPTDGAFVGPQLAALVEAIAKRAGAGELHDEVYAALVRSDTVRRPLPLFGHGELGESL